MRRTRRRALGGTCHPPKAVGHSARATPMPVGSTRRLNAASSVIAQGAQDRRPPSPYLLSGPPSPPKPPPYKLLPHTVSACMWRPCCASVGPAQGGSGDSKARAVDNPALTAGLGTGVRSHDVGSDETRAGQADAPSRESAECRSTAKHQLPQVQGSAGASWPQGLGCQWPQLCHPVWLSERSGWVRAGTARMRCSVGSPSWVVLSSRQLFRVSMCRAQTVLGGWPGRFGVGVSVTVLAPVPCLRCRVRPRSHPSALL